MSNKPRLVGGRKKKLDVFDQVFSDTDASTFQSDDSQELSKASQVSSKKCALQEPLNTTHPDKTDQNETKPNLSNAGYPDILFSEFNYSDTELKKKCRKPLKEKNSNVKENLSVKKKSKPAKKPLSTPECLEIHQVNFNSFDNDEFTIETEEKRKPAFNRVTRLSTKNECSAARSNARYSRRQRSVSIRINHSTPNTEYSVRNTQELDASEEFSRCGGCSDNEVIPGTPVTSNVLRPSYRGHCRVLHSNKPTPDGSPINANNDYSHDWCRSPVESSHCVSSPPPLCSPISHQEDEESFQACGNRSSKVHEKSMAEVLNHTTNKEAEQEVYELCNQTDSITFDECIPPRMMSKCVKIGEGVYGEVFTSFSNCEPVALKIIPIEGDQLVNDCPQKKFSEILPEIVIAKKLSDLSVMEFNNTSNFCQVNRVSCVKGTFPQELLDQWDLYAERKKSENDRPDFFHSDQLFIVFEFSNGGCALESYKFQNSRESLSVLRQVVFALAVAEQALEFEHRDLHIGNVLVKKCPEELVSFTLDGENHEFETEGVFATIIDFTISRLMKDGCAVFCDISTDEGLFEGSGDIQFDVYRNMRLGNKNKWEDFHPYTNILWTSYLCAKLSKELKCKSQSRSNRGIQQHLRNLEKLVLSFDSCCALANSSELLCVS